MKEKVKQMEKVLHAMTRKVFNLETEVKELRKKEVRRNWLKILKRKWRKKFWIKKHKETSKMKTFQTSLHY